LKTALCKGVDLLCCSDWL